MEEQLPSDFDLLYDIKTKSQLITHYLSLKTELASIEEVCKSYNIDINTLIKKYNEL